MSSFTLGGQTAKQLGLVMLRNSQRPVLPSTVDRTMQISGKHGAWDFGADLSPRLFNLECAFVTRNPTLLQEQISELAKYLVDAYGRPRNLTLVFSIQPERSYTVRYSGALPVERIVGLGQFSLPLIAYDPFAHGPEQVYETTITSSPETIEIESDGNIVTPPVIALTNTGLNTINGFIIKNEYLVEE